MGANDIVTKDYTDDCHVFADAFNQYIYKGKQVIDPKRLRPLDATALGVPFGKKGTGAPVQKYRDRLKYLTAMEDEDAVYLLMGVENQSKVHYAMPVKDMVYDALQYASQVEQIAKAHQDEVKKAQLEGTKGTQRRKVSKGEYLSGFYKDDRLIPVITLVLFFSAEEWDGPMSLHDMMAVQNPEILALVADYRINLIAPGNMSDEEINQFTTSLREVMMFIKYSEEPEKLNQILETDERFRDLDRKAATVISTVTGMEIEVEEEEEKVDMCGALKGLLGNAKKEGINDERVAIARKMLEEGSLSKEFIARMVNLSIEEIQAIAVG